MMLLRRHLDLAHHDSSQTAPSRAGSDRTPPGRTSLAMVAIRWTASMSRCLIDTDDRTVPVSHKTALADAFMRGFTNSPWTGGIFLYANPGRQHNPVHVEEFFGGSGDGLRRTGEKR